MFAACTHALVLIRPKISLEACSNWAHGARGGLSLQGITTMAGQVQCQDDEGSRGT
jgi:hypothetical protein